MPELDGDMMHNGENPESLPATKERGFDTPSLKYPEQVGANARRDRQAWSTALRSGRSPQWFAGSNPAPCTRLSRWFERQ